RDYPFSIQKLGKDQSTNDQEHAGEYGQLLLKGHSGGSTFGSPTRQSNVLPGSVMICGGCSSGSAGCTTGGGVSGLMASFNSRAAPNGLAMPAAAANAIAAFGSKPIGFLGSGAGVAGGAG